MATGLRGATRRASINDGRSERNAQLVKSRKRSSQLSKIAVDAMSQVDPIGSAFNASDKARDIANTEVDAGVARPLPLKNSFADGASDDLDVTRQVRVYVELYDTDAHHVIHTVDYLDYLEPVFEGDKMSFPDEVSVRQDKIPNFNGFVLADKSELDKTERISEAGGTEDHEFEANFMISVTRSKTEQASAADEAETKTVSSSGRETKTVTRTIKFIDDNGRTVEQSRETFTFNGIRKGDSVTWSDESHEFALVSMIDNDDYVVEEPGEKRVVTPDAPSEVLTEVKVLPKRVLDTMSSSVTVSAFINANGAVFKQEPVDVTVAFQKFRSDEHDEFDILDPEGTIERAIRSSYRGSDFSVKDISVDVQNMSALVELGMPDAVPAIKADKQEDHVPAKSDSSVKTSPVAQMSEIASRFGVGFKSAHVADDFVEPSDSELDALYETHVGVTKSLSRELNIARENAGLNKVETRILDRNDALSLYEWASDASLKKRTSKSRVLNNVIQKLGSEYESELLMNTRAIRSTCDEDAIANHLMGSVRQAERSGASSALMAVDAKYVTAVALVSNVSSEGDSMHLSASVVMTR